jgi:hypothetical protein
VPSSGYAAEPVAGRRAQEQLEEQPPVADRDGLLTAVERLPTVQEAALIHDEVVPEAGA